MKDIFDGPPPAIEPGEDGGPIGGEDGAAKNAPPHDGGLLGLVLIARFHQIPVTPEGLWHQFAPVVKKIGEPALFR